MKKKHLLLMALTFVSFGLFAQSKITINGHVKFIEDGFKITVFQRSGTSRNVLAETLVNEDNTY